MNGPFATANDGSYAGYPFKLSIAGQARRPSNLPRTLLLSLSRVARKYDGLILILDFRIRSVLIPVNLLIFAAMIFFCSFGRFLPL